MTTKTAHIAITADPSLNCGCARSSAFASLEGQYAHKALVAHILDCVRSGFGVTSPIHVDDRFYQGTIGFWWE